jgi:palmitoyl-protein thioesterase
LSEWFGEFNATSGEHTPLQKRALYKEDWLGLKVLDEKKGLVFLEAEGGHVLFTFWGLKTD